MKKIITYLLIMSSMTFGQLHIVNFESTSSYSTDPTEFSDGAGDFFTRTDGTNIGSYYSVSGVQGSYYFAAMDIDGDGVSLPVTLDITGVNITGQTGLQLSILLAEDDDGTNEDWDASDYVHIDFQIDGSGWQNLLWLENDGSTFNSTPQLDTDFDGTGDGTAITSTFSEFITNISGTGSSIDIRITFNLDAGDEDIAIDNIILGSNETPLPVELTTFTALMVDNDVKLNWETATEVNNYGFEVERKILKQVQNDSWEKVGFVEGHGNSNSPKFYSYTDNTIEASGKYNYRLKQIDIDGTFEYSDIVEANLGTPEQFELDQNFPNPFNPTTSIRFNLPTDSNVKLNVFNVLGEEVAELLNENIIAGYHSVDFNASHLNSGIYFYKLETNIYTQIRKMMLVK